MLFSKFKMSEILKLIKNLFVSLTPNDEGKKAFTVYHLFQSFLIFRGQLLRQLLVLGPLEFLANEFVVWTHLLALDGRHQLILDLKNIFDLDYDCLDYSHQISVEPLII